MTRVGERVRRRRWGHAGEGELLSEHRRDVGVGMSEAGQHPTSLGTRTPPAPVRNCALARSPRGTTLTLPGKGRVVLPPEGQSAGAHTRMHPRAPTDTHLHTPYWC